MEGKFFFYPSSIFSKTTKNVSSPKLDTLNFQKIFFAFKYLKLKQSKNVMQRFKNKPFYYQHFLKCALKKEFLTKKKLNIH